MGRQALRRQSDAALLKSIEQVLSEWPCYGYRRVTAELRRPVESAQSLAKMYQERLIELGLRGSMSRPGTPTDNPKAESFMKTLKYEEVYALDYETWSDVRDRLPRFLYEVYNRRRIHSALNYLTPEEFELQSASRTVN